LGETGRPAGGKQQSFASSQGGKELAHRCRGADRAEFERCADVFGGGVGYGLDQADVGERAEAQDRRTSSGRWLPFQSLLVTYSSSRGMPEAAIA